MDARPPWQYDEFKHLATDFHSPQQVETYDARQHTDIAKEERLVEELNIDKSHTVLEYGSGTGGFTLAAAKVCQQVYAVDISQAMLDYARSRIRTAKLHNVEFIQAGFLTYIHHNKPVDIIVTKFAFHHLPDFWKSVALMNMYKYLKPNGVLIIEDVVFSFSPEQHQEELQNWIDTQSGSQQSFSKEDFEGHIRDEHSTFAWVIEGLLRQAGFRIEQARCWSPIYAHYRCRKN